jgi:hypothetical protein
MLSAPLAGVAWYRGPSTPAAPGYNPVLLQISWADELGDLRPSASWRLAGFADRSQG